MPNPEHIGLLIASARRCIKQAVLVRAAPHGLAPQQFWLLVALHEHPGLSQVEIAERVRADAPTVSRVVAGLARRKLVTTSPDPRDRRRLRLALTPSGERMAAKLVEAAREVRACVTRGLDETEQEALRRSLKHVISNMERAAEPAEVRRDHARGHT